MTENKKSFADVIIKELEEIAFSDTKMSGRDKLKALEMLAEINGVQMHPPKENDNSQKISKLMEILKNDVQ